MGEACRGLPKGVTCGGTDRNEGLDARCGCLSLNRRMRTRMSGGVGGGAGDDPSYPIPKWALRRALRQQKSSGLVAVSRPSSVNQPRRSTSSPSPLR